MCQDAVQVSNRKTLSSGGKIFALTFSRTEGVIHSSRGARLCKFEGQTYFVPIVSISTSPFASFSSTRHPKSPQSNILKYLGLVHILPRRWLTSALALCTSQSSLCPCLHFWLRPPRTLTSAIAVMTAEEKELAIPASSTA